MNLILCCVCHDNLIVPALVISKTLDDMSVLF